MATRKELAARSRERILNAALDLISEKGYDKVSVSAIMKECGMSVGNFYHYFNAKEDLIAALERDSYEHANQELLLMRNLPIERQLRFYIMNWAQTETVRHHSPNYGRQWFIYYLSNSTSWKDPNNKINVAKNEIQSCFQHAIENGELRSNTPAEALAYQLSFEIIGMYLFFIMTDASFPMLDWANNFCEHSLKNIIAPYYAES